MHVSVSKLGRNTYCVNCATVFPRTAILKQSVSPSVSAVILSCCLHRVFTLARLSSSFFLLPLSSLGCHESPSILLRLDVNFELMRAKVEAEGEGERERGGGRKITCEDRHADRRLPIKSTQSKGEFSRIFSSSHLPSHGPLLLSILQYNRRRRGVTRD